ncbi:MAG: LPS assembly protein LptD [Xanthobacteraceae bacterium]
MFSGWDRIEGGGRANAGLQYIAQFNGGGSVNMLFGQSYHLFGTNSFAVGDTTNTGLGSGLDKPNSDYVARFAYAPNRIFNVISRYRFAGGGFHVETLRGRRPHDGGPLVGRVVVRQLCGAARARRLPGSAQGLLAQGSIKLTANWPWNGAARYDIKNNISQTQVGLGYIDDCLLFGLTYVTDHTYSTSVPDRTTPSCFSSACARSGSTNSSGLGSSSASSLGTLQ